jgi:hypothetical protein
MRYSLNRTQLAAGLVVLGWTLIASSPARAQGYGALYQPPRAKPMTAKLQHAPSQARYMNPTRDLYNKYFYSRPSVSPYLNLGRPTVGGTTAYHTFVRPEQQRREQAARQQSAYIAARKRETGFQPMNSPLLAPTPRPQKPAGNAYYNQWYGSHGYR